MSEIVCSRCGKTEALPFEASSKRAYVCRRCYGLLRNVDGRREPVRFTTSAKPYRGPSHYPSRPS